MKAISLVLLIWVLQTSAATAHLPPIAEFSATGLCYGDTSRFINLSTGGVYSTWIIQKWDSILNDTITLDSASTTNLSYLFPSPGTYYITLREDNGHVVAITKQITIGNSTLALFSFQACTNNFINMSTCTHSCLWDFGDGNTSAIPITTHQYADTGSYMVTLIVYNGMQSDTLIKQIKVTELGFPKPQFQVRLSNDTAYCKITGGIWTQANLTWYYGDNTSATSADTFHVFQDTGSYYVKLRVWNSCGAFMKDTILTIIHSTYVRESSVVKSNPGLFPNPVDGILTITLEKTESIKSICIYSLMGQKKMEEYNLDNSAGINLNQLQTGVYIIYIKTDQNFYCRKFMKQ